MYVYNIEVIVVDDSEFDDLSEVDKVLLMLYNVFLLVVKKVKNDVNVDDIIKIEIDLLVLSKLINLVV